MFEHSLGKGQLGGAVFLVYFGVFFWKPDIYSIAFEFVFMFYKINFEKLDMFFGFLEK